MDVTLHISLAIFLSQGHVWLLAPVRTTTDIRSAPPQMSDLSGSHSFWHGLYHFQKSGLPLDAVEHSCNVGKSGTQHGLARRRAHTLRDDDNRISKFKIGVCIPLLGAP